MPEIEDYGAREPSKHEKAAARRLALAQTHPGFREKKRERGTLGGPRELLANPVDTSGSRGFLRRGEKKRAVQRPPIDQELRHTKDGDRYVSWNPLSNTMYVRIPERCVAAEPAASLFYPPAAVAKAESVDYVDPKQKLKEIERERTRLLNEIDARRQAAVLLQKRARGMEARAEVQRKREKRRLVQAKKDAAAAEIQRIARGKKDRKRVQELREQRTKEWYLYVDWNENAHKAATKIQCLARGRAARKKTPVVQPFQFAVGGYIFQHPGRKRPSADATKALRSVGAQAAKRHIDMISERTLRIMENVSPDSLGHAKSVPDGPGMDVNVMFDMFDINSDGLISVQDLKHVWAALGAPKLPQGTDMADMLHAGDTNGDGMLSKNEFEDFMREVNIYMNDDEAQEEQAKVQEKAKAAMTGAEKREMMLKRLKGELTMQEIEDAGLTTGKKTHKKKK